MQSLEIKNLLPEARGTRKARQTIFFLHHGVFCNIQDKQTLILYMIIRIYDVVICGMAA